MEHADAQGGEAFKISFIITFYNIPLDMLRQCIESILSLSLKPEEREIVLVDDGSPINPSPVLEEYGDSIVYVVQMNQGPAIARNVGLEKASGTHIQYVDADDYLLKEGYEYCIDLVRNDGQTDVVTIDFTQDLRHKGQATCKRYETGADYMLANNLRGIDWAYLFRRSALGDWRFTPGILHEDEEFAPMLMLRSGKVCVTNSCAYFYRRRDDSIVNKADQAHVQKRLEDMEKVIGRLDSVAATLSGIRQDALLRRIHQLTMDHLYNTIRLTGSASKVEKTVERLQSKCLFPLPDKRYTRKYDWFRRLLNSRLGRRILLFALS